jgi:hypothetical protein
MTERYKEKETVAEPTGRSASICRDVQTDDF